MVGVGPPGPAVGGGAAQCQGLVEVAGERRRQRGGLVGGAGVALMGRYVRHYLINRSNESRNESVETTRLSFYGKKACAEDEPSARRNQYN